MSATKKISPGALRNTAVLSKEALIDAEQDLIADVQYLLEAVLRDKRITRREIARRLNKSEATISRALDGASNLRLKTIADIAAALDDHFQVSSEHFEQMKLLGRVQPLYPSTSTLAEVARPDLLWRKVFQVHFVGAAQSANAFFGASAP